MEAADLSAARVGERAPGRFLPLAGVARGRGNIDRRQLPRADLDKRSKPAKLPGSGSSLPMNPKAGGRQTPGRPTPSPGRGLCKLPGARRCNRPSTTCSATWQPCWSLASGVKEKGGSTIRARTLRAVPANGACPLPATRVREATVSDPRSELRSLVVQRARRNILRVEFLEVRSGQVVVVLGPNGAGKSTLLKCLFGFVRPTTGEIQVLGTRVSPRSGSRSPASSACGLRAAGPGRPGRESADRA